MKEVCQYITCPKGHKVFVIWSNEKKRFAFTCNECEQHSERAASLHGVIEIKIVDHGERA